jgi:hypothetical protein
MNSELQILRRYEGRCLRSRDHRVWRLEVMSRGIQWCRSRLLHVLCRSNCPYVQYGESPPEEPKLRGSQKIKEGLWRLPSHCSAAALQRWLYAGNWQLYLASAPLLDVADLCRADDLQIVEFMDRHGVGAVIDSFHDNVEWTVGISQLNTR